MKKLTILSTVLLLAGCATGQAPVTGVFATSTQMGITATNNPTGSKQGEACAHSLLGAVATGDASINTAKRNAGITKVSTVDYSTQSFIGLYAKVCIIVTGE